MHFEEFRNEIVKEIPGSLLTELFSDIGSLTCIWLAASVSLMTELLILGDPKKYSPLTKHQTITFCSITYMYSDSKSLFLNVDSDTSASQIQ